MAIEQDAFVESVTKDAAGIQVGFLPGLDGTGHHVAPDAATGDGLVDFVVAKRPLAQDEQVVVTVRAVGPARPASEQDDGPRIQSIRE